jgi:NADPH:quinone reductase-like Zn-dependent oxidoreductase
MGEVVTVGTMVTRFEVGDRVVGTFFQDWESGTATENQMNMRQSITSLILIGKAKCES